MVDENLAQTTRARTDADGRDGELIADLAGDLVRHTFEHQRKSPGGLDRLGGLEQETTGFVAPALDLEAPETVDRLRGQPEMGHHRNLGGG